MQAQRITQHKRFVPHGTHPNFCFAKTSFMLGTLYERRGDEYKVSNKGKNGEVVFLMTKQDLEKKVSKLLKTDEWIKIRDALQLLKENTGPGLAQDPYEDPDLQIWNNVGVAFLRRNRLLEALTIFQSHLDCYLEIQEKTNKRIHKGTPYYFLGQVYLHINNLPMAREQFLFAFVEDILTNFQVGGNGSQSSRAFNNSASIVLQLTFRMREEELHDLFEFANDYFEIHPVEECLNPELVILKWRNTREKERPPKIVLTRAIEESLFRPNRFYLRKLLTETESDPTGEHMEDLATYLFSCVDGFEPIPKKQTSSFHFDVVIRNLVKSHPLLSVFGEYIGVESKNLDTTVSAEQLNHFIHKLRLHSMRCGIIFTRNGISGVSYQDDQKYGKIIQIKTFNRDNLIVFDLTLDDLQSIAKGSNLISILLLKYEDIRYQ